MTTAELRMETELDQWHAKLAAIQSGIRSCQTMITEHIWHDTSSRAQVALASLEQREKNVKAVIMELYRRRNRYGA